MPHTPAIPSTPEILVSRRIVEAGLLACVVGLIAHGLLRAVSLPRLGETLALALLWSGVAMLAARGLRWRLADAIAGLALVMLTVMWGPLPVIAAALLAAACIGLGTLLVRDAVLAGVLGAGLVAGIAGWSLPWPLHRTWTWAPLLVAIVAWRWRQVAPPLRDGWRRWRIAIDASPRMAAAAMLALGLASAAAWLPTLQYDDLAYHLGLPWQLLRDGRYALDASQQVWALAPWAGDVLQGIAQVIARAEARGPLDVLWLAVSAALVARIAGRLGASATMQWLAVAVLATLPPIAALVGGMQTELPAMAVMLALLAIVVDDAALRHGWLVVAVLAGFLAGLKTIHIAAGLVLVVVAAARMATMRPTRWIAMLAAFVAIAASSYTYAWITCGNPVLPLFNAMFRSPCFAPTDFSDARWQTVPGVPLPWSMTFLTSRHLEAWNGGLGVLLVAFAGAALVAMGRRETRPAALCAFAAIAVPMAVLPYARYVVPGLVLLVPVAVATLSRLYAPRVAAWLIAVVCLLDVALVPNAHWLLHTGGIKRALVAGGRDAPLFARYAPERLLIDALRRDTPDAIVLDLGGASHAELGGRGRTTTWYAPALHADAATADADASGAAWARLFARHRIDAVLMRAIDATPARRAGLVLAGGHRVSTMGAVECWRLPHPRVR